MTQEAALKGITVAWGANGQISMDAEANKAAAVNATNDALIQQKFLIDQLRESELEEIKVKNASIEASKKLNAAAKALAQGIAGEYATPDFANEQAAQEWIKQKRDERQKVHQQILAMGGLDADYAMQSRWLESQYQSGLDALKNKTSMTAATNAGSVAQSAAESGKTVTVRLQNPDGRVNVVNTNDQGASGIIDAFKSAKLAAGY